MNWIPLALVLYSGVVTILMTAVALWVDWRQRYQKAKPESQGVRNSNGSGS